MGSFNYGCALTGAEIEEGTPVKLCVLEMDTYIDHLAYLTPDAIFRPKSPLLNAVYKDYGNFEIEGEDLILKYKDEEEEEEEDETSRAYAREGQALYVVRRDVFDWHIRRYIELTDDEGESLMPEDLRKEIELHLNYFLEVPLFPEELEAASKVLGKVGKPFLTEAWQCRMRSTQGTSKGRGYDTLNGVGDNFRYSKALSDYLHPHESNPYRFSPYVAQGLADLDFWHKVLIALGRSWAPGMLATQWERTEHLALKSASARWRYEQLWNNPEEEEEDHEETSEGGEE